MINFFKKTYTKKELKLFEFLSQVKLFSNLTEEELVLFVPHIHERQYKQNEVVFLRDDPSQALYILKEGLVTLNIEVNNKFEKLTTVEGVVCMGESCLLKNTRRLLNAIVASDTADFYVIPQYNILTIFENNLEIKVKMMEALAVIHNDYNRRLFKAYKTAYGFFDMSSIYGETKDM
ncbi:MAG: cyclic nucleotide-binding domain-containing protein [Bacteroidota bacterium]